MQAVEHIAFRSAFGSSLATNGDSRRDGLLTRLRGKPHGQVLLVRQQAGAGLMEEETVR